MDLPILIPDQLRPQLKSLRRVSGLTQASLGKLIGVSRARIARIERAPGSMSVEQFMQLLAALDARMVLRATIPALEDGVTKPRLGRDKAADLRSALSKWPKGSW